MRLLRPTRPASREPLWTSNYTRAVSAMHLYFVSFYALFTTLPLYLEDAPRWQIGLVVGIFGVPPIITRPAAGLLSDRLGRRRLMLPGAAISALALAGYALSPNAFVLLPFRLLHGGAMAFFTTSLLATVSDIAPASRRGEAMGYFGMVNNLAQLYAPLLGLAIARTLGFTPFFLVMALVVGACFLVAATVQEPPRQSPSTSEPLSDGRLWGLPISATALFPSLIFLTFTIPFGAVQAFLSPLAEERTLGDPGLYFLVFGLTVVAARSFAGQTADRYGRATIIIPGLVLASVAMALLAMSGSAITFFISAVLFGIGIAGTQTGLLTLTVDRAGTHERGLAVATFTLAWDVGAIIGSMAMGIVADWGGYTLTFLLVSAITFSGAAVFTSSRRSHWRSSEQREAVPRP